jgi:hypothetical protein
MDAAQMAMDTRGPVNRGGSFHVLRVFVVTTSNFEATVRGDKDRSEPA